MKTKKNSKSMFTPQIRSRHPSHNVLRKTIGMFPVRSIIRLGSITQLQNDNKKRIEINTPNAVSNSASKLKMKKCFTQAKIKTPNWYTSNGKMFFQNGIDSTSNKGFNDLKFPIISKSLFGSRGRGNTKLDSIQQLQNWMKGKDLTNYIFEEFFDGSREYRFHVSTLGVFLTWRKLRKNDTPDNQRWFFNNQNCNWVSEQHELYNKPLTYDEICKECLKALNSVGLDLGGCDVRVNKKGEFKIIEINSACSLAEITALAYRKELSKLINNKINN